MEFEALLQAVRGPLERFVRFRMEGTGEAEDILQEVYLTAWEKFSSLRDPEQFKPWIMQIARNKCRDYYRRGKPETASLEDAALTLASPGQEDPLADLPLRDRRLIELRYLTGLHEAEIAALMGLPVGTVKSRTHAARRRLLSARPHSVKGACKMYKLPEYLPEYTIEPSPEAPFPVVWEEIMGWFIVPKEGQTLKWAMYDFPSRKRTMYVDMAVQGRAKVHGIEGVRIRSVEHDPVPSEQIGDQKDVERFLVAQLTDTHCRLLAESHTSSDGVREYYTFLDGDDFLENWGFGPDNCGNEIHLHKKGLIHQNGDVITTGDTDWPLDIVGRYTVTIGGKSYDTVCVWDVECYEYQNGVCSQQFLDQNGRTILWRRFNRDDWAFHHFGKRWTEILPDNERVTINGQTYVHWYDCITDYILDK